MAAFIPAELPPSRRKHVAVIGAGFVGLASALWLQARGHQVTLVDRQPPLGNAGWRQAASYGNACTVAPQAVLPVATPGLVWQVPAMIADQTGPLSIRWRYLPHLLPWLLAFLRAGRKAEVDRIIAVLASLLGQAEAGWTPLFDMANARHLLRRNGCLYLYKSQAEFDAADAWHRRREQHGVNLTRLDAGAVREMEPNLAPLYHRGVLFDDAFPIDSPRQLADRLARRIVENGGTFLAGEATGVGGDGSRVAFSVDGAGHRADHLVVASGAHSARLARQLGDRILLDTERGYHVLFPEAGRLLTRPVCFAEEGFYMTPMADGLRAAGTVELGGLEAPPNPRRADVIAKGVERFVPRAGRAGETWMGFRPSMPDSLPVIGNSPTLPNVTYAFGHGHIGLTLAGVTGRLVSELVCGEPPHIDVAPLRCDRFSRWGWKRQA